MSSRTFKEFRSKVEDESHMSLDQYSTVHMSLRAFNDAREGMKEQLLEMLKGCLVRDPTLQKLYDEVSKL